MQQQAVVVKNAYKRYGKGQPLVLDGLNMTISQGCIYGLLGASGCGKTTLLSCIVGVRKLNQGDVWVLGGRPGQKNSGIPGPRVGYMPQEISLVGEFSVVEALFYFGRINGLEDSDIEERYMFLSRLLLLPPKNQVVKHLSGGQQRRLSLAATLLHKPDLLILDEPTVGLDPILRENIWQFFIKLTKEEGTAVVITTHYIEETKLADKIGLLRCGQLLAEMSPTMLLSKFNCEYLEDAFLILSKRQEDSRNPEIAHIDNDRVAINSFEEIPAHIIPDPQASGDLSNNDSSVNRKDRIIDNQDKRRNISPPRLSSFNKIFKALITKNLVQILRNPSGIMFAFLLPIILTTTFFCSVGGDLNGIILAVVNDEAGHCDYGRNLGEVIYVPDQKICDYIDISCRFLHGFHEPVMKKQYFNTLEEATRAVQSGKASGAMYFSRNFSQALQRRRDAPIFLGEGDIVASQIQTTVDMTNRQIGLSVQDYVTKNFFKVNEEILSSCNYPKKYATLPIRFKKPVFGKEDQEYSYFMAPAFIQLLTFFMATGVSGLIIIADLLEGVWDRSLVQGVSTSIILFSHILTQMLLVIIQVTVLLVATFTLFQMPCQGNFVLVIMLVLLSGISGVCYGILISSACNNLRLAYFVANGSLLPATLLSGFFWPLEGMPTFLRYISYILPSTVPTLALRGVLDKGYSIFAAEVYSGFLVEIGWIFIFVTLSLICIRRRV